MDYSMHGMSCGGGWMFMGLWWILIIIAVVLAVSWVNRKGFPSTQQKIALDILKERYARGEISKDEFENMKKDIN